MSAEIFVTKYFLLLSKTKTSALGMSSAIVVPPKMTISLLSEKAAERDNPVGRFPTTEDLDSCLTVPLNQAKLMSIASKDARTPVGLKHGLLII